MAHHARPLKQWKKVVLVVIVYLIFSPALEKVVLDAETIKYLSDGLIDNIFDVFGLMIKGGYGRQNMGAHIGGHCHQAQMSFVQGSFSDYQY